VSDIELEPESISDARASSQVEKAEREASEVRSRIAGWIPAEIATLPDIYRAPMELLSREQLDLKETAAALGLGLSTVKVRIHRGRRMIKQRIERCCRLIRDATGRVIDYEENPPVACCG